MTSVSLGPLALPVVPLLWLAAWWLAQAVAARGLARPWAGADRGAVDVGEAARAERLRSDAEALRTAFWWAAGGGLLAARLVFVVLAWPVYAAAPLSLLDLRDGGWHAPAGAAGLGLVLAGFAWRRAAWRRALALGVLVGSLAWAAGWWATGQHRQPPLPDVALVGPDGRPASLAALVQGRPAVVNLWASWCAPCRVEMPVLAAAQARHASVRFLFVNQGESDAPIQRYLAAQPFRLDGVWRDPAGALGPAVGSSGLPTTLFIDAEGRIVARHFGPLSAGSLAGRLASLGVAPGH